MGQYSQTDVWRNGQVADLFMKKHVTHTNTKKHKYNSNIHNNYDNDQKNLRFYNLLLIIGKFILASAIFVLTVTATMTIRQKRINTFFHILHLNKREFYKRYQIRIWSNWSIYNWSSKLEVISTNAPNYGQWVHWLIGQLLKFWVKNSCQVSECMFRSVLSIHSAIYSKPMLIGNFQWFLQKLI